MRPVFVVLSVLLKHAPFGPPLLAFAIVGGCTALAGVFLTAELSSASAITATGYELTVIAVVGIGGTSLNGEEGTLFGSFTALNQNVAAQGLHAERTNKENTGHDILPKGGNIQNVERTADDSEKQSADDQARIYKSRFGPICPPSCPA